MSFSKEPKRRQKLNEFFSKTKHTNFQTYCTQQTDTVLSQFCHSLSQFVTVLSQFCHSFVTVCHSSSQFCHSLVTVLSQFCHSFVTVCHSLSQFCHLKPSPIFAFKVECRNTNRSSTWAGLQILD